MMMKKPPASPKKPIKDSSKRVSSSIASARKSATPDTQSVTSDDALKQPAAEVESKARVAKSKAKPSTSKSTQDAEAKAPPKASLQIFQIYYEAWQKELLDPQMVPLNNNTPVKSELYEFDVFKKLYETDYVKNLALWGAVSWRFNEKTKLTGKALQEDIIKNPGFDVYFCNPVMEIESLYHNVWMQGEISHPNFLAVALEFFKAAEIPTTELISLESSRNISVANYFIGNQRFWQTYIAWIDKKLSLANKGMAPKIRELMHSKIADDKMLHGGATYVPFIVERLFSVFMHEHQKVLKSHKISLPQSTLDANVHLKLLREMKDTAIATQSKWLAACWVNYRNLYFTQLMGKDWVRENLSRITPKDILFR
jgi:hypothetical protein